MSVIIFKPKGAANEPKKTPIDIKEYTSRRHISLDSIFDIIKHGDEIGISTYNNDSEDNMHRGLELENVRIELIEWRVLSIWTIKIEVFSENKSLLVYRSPYLNVDWQKESVKWAEDSERGMPLEVQWDEKGQWCYYIAEKLSVFSKKLDDKRRADRHEKDDRENLKNREAARLRTYFNGLFKDMK